MTLTVKQLIRNCTESEHSLKEVESIVKKACNGQLNNLDRIYIENKYIKYCLKCWLKEIATFINERAAIDNKIIDQLVTLNNIEHFNEIPEPFNELKYYKLLMSHEDVLQYKEQILMKLFKEECLNFSMSHCNTVTIEVDFLHAMLAFLDMFEKHQRYPDMSELKQLAEPISNKDFFQIIMDLDITKYDEKLKQLQYVTLSLMDKEHISLMSKYKEIMGAYFKPATIEKLTTDNRLIVQVIGGNFYLSDIVTNVNAYLSRDSQIEEVRFICSGIMYIDANLKNDVWHGKNIVVYTKAIRICKNVEWNISGKSAISIAIAKASADDNGNGMDGEHGKCGESGGNVLIHTPNILNPEQLRILSNGGDGSNGQSGGDGKDGRNGTGISYSDFNNKFPTCAKFHGGNAITNLRTTVRNIRSMGNIRVSWCDEKDCSIDDILNRRQRAPVFVEAASDEGHEIYFSNSMSGQVFILYKGSLGRPGGRGGAAGSGGQGGYPGEIISSDPKIITVVNSGKDGKKGTDGKYGIHGKNGWDMGFIDWAFWNNGIYYGKNENKKLKLEFWNSSDSERAYIPYRKYQNSDYTYAQLSEISIPQPSSTEITEKEKTSTQSEHQTRTERKKNISQNHIFSQYSQHMLKTDTGLYYKLQTQMENTEKNAFKKMMENKKQQIKEISQVHVTRTKPSSKSMKIYDDTSFSNSLNESQQLSRESIESLLTNLCQSSLNDWSVLNSLQLEYSHFDGLFDHLETLEQMLTNSKKKQQSKKSKETIDVQQSQQLENVQELLMKKYRSAILQQIAIKMSQYITNSQFELTAKKAIKYLVPVKSNLLTNLGYCKVLGDLQQYFFEDTSAQRQEISKFCTTENITKYTDAFKYSIGAFVMDEGGEKEAHPTIKKYYQEYSKFIGEQEVKLKQFYADSKLDIGSYHETIDRFLKSLNNASAQLKLKEEVKKNKQMKTLYEKFVKKFSVRYSWDKCLKDPEVLKIHVQHIQKRGPLSPSYRELLAYVFDINIRIYITNQFKQISLLDVHNPYSTEIVYLLYTNEKFTLLDINQEYLHLDTERIGKADQYTKIIAEVDSLKNRIECNNYLRKELFFSKSKDNNTDFTSETAIDEKQDMFDIIRLFPEEDRQKVRCLLEKISSKYIGQNVILHAIAKCFSCDGRHITYNELYYLTNAVLSFVINDNPGLNVFRWIIMAHSQCQWINEVILLKLENYFKKSIPEIYKWRKNLANIREKKTLLLLFSKLERSKSNFTIECITSTLYLLSNISEPVPGLELLELSEWPYAIKEKYWSTKLSILTKWEDEQLQRATYYLLSIENNVGTSLVDEFMDLLTQKNDKLQSNKSKGLISSFLLGWKSESSLSIEDFLRILSSFNNGEWTFSKEVFAALANCKIVDWIAKMKEIFPTDGKDRDISKLIQLIQSNGNTSGRILTNLNQIKDIIQTINQRKPVNESELIKKITAHKSNLEICIEENKKLLYIQENAVDILNLIDNAILLKKNFRLRDTQKLAILTLLMNQKSTLMQVSTGEGKSLIVVALSIFKALCNQKIDIITSSSVLAKRDSEINNDIYKLFSVSVSHNCEDDVERRKEVYSCKNVVYGELAGFQRDYLLDRFYGKNILGDRKFENIVIDEVDSMLLDKGNNMLYLSHDLPSLDKLESIYVYIWQRINKPFSNKEEFLQTFDSKMIRNAVLCDLYGSVSKKSLSKINGKISGQQINTIWGRLIKYNIINSDGYLLQDKVSEEDVKVVLSSDFENYKRGLFHLFKEITKRERFIRVPNYLKPFIMLHLDSWINSAKSAFFMQERQDYVVDIDRTGNRPDLRANITIIDRDTGTDQTNSQWDEALHQFLQLKHGCKLSMQSLKAVFVSNVRYLKLYDNLYGLTGTLGSQRERHLLRDIYGVDFVTVPTTKTRQFQEHKPIACSNLHDWRCEIRKEADKIIAAGRSMLIICETVQQVESLCCEFDATNVTNVHTYTRDYESFDVGADSSHLCVGQIIIATNLAGRGTDIKITDKLNRADGLHVCLAYLPNNNRVEQQAFGRAARCGNNGSGKLIILSPSQQTHSATNISQMSRLKKERDFEEIRRISNIKLFYEAQISVEEDAFRQFKEQYVLLKDNLKTNSAAKEVTEILLRSCLDEWAFWLDENSKYINGVSGEQDVKKYNASLGKFIDRLQALKSKDHEDWICWTKEPAQIVKLAKYFAENKKQDMAIKLFDRVIKEESYYSEVAHYYKAFALIKNLNKKDRAAVKELKKVLRQAATLMEKHRDYALLTANIIDNLKQRNPGILQIDAFNEQHKNISILYQIFLQSIDDIFGHSITPKNFVKYDITEELAETLYYDLIKNSILKEPRVSKNIPEESVKEISKQYGVIWNVLNTFLLKYCGNTINARQFEKDFKNSVEIANKEDFWKLLVKANILSKEMKYVKINVQKLRNIDPSFLTSLNCAVEKKILIKETLKCNEQELLLNVVENVDTDDDIILKKSLFKNYIDSQKYIILKRKNVFTFNKKATFNASKVDSVRFSSFDSITPKNFTEQGFLPEETQQILDDLVKSKVLTKEEDKHYRLVASYDKIKQLKLPSYPIYEGFVIQLLSVCFMYRIALQKLVKNMEEKVSLSLQLVTKPHQSIFCSLVAKRIIKIAKVSNDTNKLENKLNNMYERIMHGKDSFIHMLYKDDLISRTEKDEKILNYALSNNWIDILESLEQNVLTNATDAIKGNSGKKCSLLGTIEDPTTSSTALCAYYALTVSERNKILIFVDNNTLHDIRSSVKYEGPVETIKLIIDARDNLGRKATIKNIASTLQALKNVFKTLDVPDFTLSCLIKQIEENRSFNGGDYPTEELHVFALNGLNHLLTLREKPWTWKMILKTAAVIVLGIAQIVLGNVITLLSAGSLSFLGGALISEGISDIFFAVSALRSGYFTWSSYARHKMLSLAITGITFGIGAWYSSSTTNSYGMSIIGPNVTSGGQEITKMGGSELVKELTRESSKLLTKEFTKRVALSTLHGVAFGLTSTGVDWMIDNYLQSLCKNIGFSILEEIDKTVDKHNMSKTLEMTYRTLGREDATAMIKELTSNYFTPNSSEFSQICTRVVCATMDAIKQAKAARSAAVTSCKIKALMKLVGPAVTLLKKALVLTDLRKLTLNMLSTLDNAIQAKVAQMGKDIRQTKNSTSKDDPEDMHKFKQEIVEMWKTMLRDRAGRVIDEEIVRPVMHTAAVMLVSYIGKTIQTTYEDYKERKYTEEFEHCKQEYQKKMEELSDEPEEVRKVAEKEYHNNLKDLLKKTCNPKLFADIIRENVPMDTVCVAACLPVIQRMLASRGINTLGLTIIVDEESGLSEKLSTAPEGHEGAVIRIKLVDDHYISGNENDALPNSSSVESTNNCLYDALCQRIPELREMSADDFRKEIAKEIETSPGIRDRLSQGWHRYKIGVGLIGGRKPIRKNSIKREEQERSTFKPNEKNDVDLRTDKTLSNSELQKQRTEALNIAVDKILEHLKGMKDVNRNDISFDINDLQVTKYDTIFVVDSENNVTLAYFPVEMELQLEVLVPKTKNDTDIIYININIDNPCVYNVEHGPQVPHVGFEVTGRGNIKVRERGHILINEIGNEYLPHRRPDNISIKPGETLPNYMMSQVPVYKLFEGPSNFDLVLARNDPSFDHSDIKGKNFPTTFY